MINQNQMKKLFISFTLFALLFSLTSALELDEYPEFLLGDDELNINIVVGDKAPVSHVLAQTKIALSLGSFYNRPLKNSNKLASEIEDIDDLNLISIGSACDNEVTSKILNNPEPCDKDLQQNKAVIELLESGEGKSHIVLTSVSEDGIRELADILANYENFDLTETRYEIEIKVEEIEEIIEVEIVEETTPDVISEEKPKEEVPKVRIIETDNEPEPVLKEEDDLVKIVINWFKSLFGFFKK